jgi:hypothetical protein
MEQVLESLVESLDQFDQVMAQGAEGRMHIAAGVELDVEPQTNECSRDSIVRSGFPQLPKVRHCMTTR